jgi:hypothetical protein
LVRSQQQRYSPVLTRLSGQRGWPAQSIVLPGNEVLFSLETASDYVKGGEGGGGKNSGAHFGFKCLVAGYEVLQDGGGLEQQGLKSLEHELAYLGGLCAASLMSKSLRLPRSPTPAITGTGSKGTYQFCTITLLIKCTVARAGTVYLQFLKRTFS